MPPSLKIFDRLPPQNLEAEVGVLGSILLDGRAMIPVASALRGWQDFYRDSHQTLYRVLAERHDAGEPVDDTYLVADDLARRGLLERLGGDEFLATILQSVPHAAHAAYYAGVVRQKAILRDLIDACNDVLNECYSDSLTAAELVERAEARIFKVASEAAGSNEVRAFAAAADAALARLRERAAGGAELAGLRTGLPDLDAMTGGFKPSQLIVVGARPAMGKTALLVTILEHFVLALGRPALLVSLEMDAEDIAERELVAHSGVFGGKVRSGALNDLDFRALESARDRLAHAPLYIDDSPGRSMAQIASVARQHHARHGLAALGIDYVQLIDPEDGRDGRQEQIAKISRRLKKLARELKVPVIALSQLNREVEKRESHRPRMADLRESGAMENDADLVLLLHRPAYYDPPAVPAKVELAELIVAKQRNGPTGTVKLGFEAEATRFGPWDDLDGIPESAPEPPQDDEDEPF